MHKGYYHQMNRVCYMHIIEYYSVIKNKVLIQTPFFLVGKANTMVACYMKYSGYTYIHTYSLELYNLGFWLLGNRGGRVCMRAVVPFGMMILFCSRVHTSVRDAAHWSVYCRRKDSLLCEVWLSLDKPSKPSLAPPCVQMELQVSSLSWSPLQFHPSPHFPAALLSPLPFLPRGRAATLRSLMAFTILSSVLSCPVCLSW